MVQQGAFGMGPWQPQAQQQVLAGTELQAGGRLVAVHDVAGCRGRAHGPGAAEQLVHEAGARLEAVGCFVGAFQPAAIEQIVVPVHREPSGCRFAGELPPQTMYPHGPRRLLPERTVQGRKRRGTGGEKDVGAVLGNFDQGEVEKRKGCAMAAFPFHHPEKAVHGFSGTAHAFGEAVHRF